MSEEGAGPVAGEAESNWYSGFDQETVGWLENKGISKLDQPAAMESLVKGFRGAEKYIGVPKEQLLRLPDFNKADKVELDAFYTKLGRPDDPKGYEITSDNPDFADFAATMFHEAGLTKAQTDKVVAKWDEYVTKTNGGMTEQAQLNSAAQKENLHKEWGAAYEKNLQIAKITANKLGIQESQIDGMESVLGFDGVMKLMVQLGQGEDSFVSGDSPNGPMTPTQAQAKIKQLQEDKAWTMKYLKGNTDAREEMDRLMRMAHP
jgi:hypothetical protein